MCQNTGTVQDKEGEEGIIQQGFFSPLTLGAHLSQLNLHLPSLSLRS